MGLLGKLLSQTAIYGVSAIVSKFLNYLLTPYLTYTLMDNVFGQVSLMYAAIPFLNVILSMGLSTAYFRWAGKADSKADKDTIFTSVLKFVVILAIAFFALSIIFSRQIDSLFGYGKQTYVILVAALVAVDNINTVSFSGLRQEGKAGFYTIINITNVVVNIILCICFYSFIPGATSEAGWVLIANLVASLVSTLMLSFWTRKHLAKPSKKILVQMLSFSVPLMLGGLMGISNDFIDKQFMRWLLPEDVAFSSIGIYTAIAKIAALIMILRQIFTLGAEPFFLQKYSTEDFKNMNAAVLKYFLLVGLTAVLVILLYLDYFLLIIGAPYRSGAPAAAPLLFANLIMGLVISLSFWYKAEGKGLYAIKITVWGLVVTIVSASILIPKIGYMGAAYTQLASSAAMFISSFIYNQKHAQTPYETGRLVLYSVSAIAIYCISLEIKNCLPEILYDISAFGLLIMFIGMAAMLELRKKQSYHES